MSKFNIFCDESGCPELFGKRGKIDLTKTSKYFLICQIRIDDCNLLKAYEKFDNLRNFISADKDLSNLNQFKEGAKFIFHACKDDHRIRNLVFTMLEDISYTCVVCIRRKDVLISKYEEIFAKTGEKISVNYLYQETIEKLFFPNIHTKGDINISFSNRSGIDVKNFPHILSLVETKILSNKDKFNIPELFPRRNVKIYNCSPKYLKTAILNNIEKLDYVGLQIADYTLWALQRFLEKNDSFYLKILEYSNKYRWIMDVEKSIIKGYNSTNKKISERWLG
jgi:hypothetical protein